MTQKHSKRSMGEVPVMTVGFNRQEEDFKIAPSQGAQKASIKSIVVTSLGQEWGQLFQDWKKGACSLLFLFS